MIAEGIGVWRRAAVSGSGSALSTYIFDTMPLGSSSSCDASCASLLADYILDVLNESNEEVTGQTVGFIQTLTDIVTITIT